MDQLYKDKEWLKNKLESIGNLKQIGDLCGVSGDTIEYWRKKHNLPKAQKGLQVNRKQTINHNYFEEINTAEKAYWLGFIMADGTISSNGKYYSRLEINLKKNDDEFELLQQFNKALQSSYEIKEILVKNKKRNCESWIFNLRINSKKMVSDLMKHGIVPKKNWKRIYS